MPVTVTGKNYTQLSSCDTATSGGTWAGATFTVDSDTRKEGAAALSCILKAAGDNTITFTAAQNLQNKHLRIWLLLTHGGILNTYANGGIQFFVTGGGNTGYWKVGGRDTYPGGWINLVIDTSKACDSGTKPTDMTAITASGFRINLTIAGKNVINTFFDNFIAADGLIAYGDYAGNYFSLEHIYAADGEMQVVTLDTGNAVVGDIGLPVHDVSEVLYGYLFDYNNTAKQWWVWGTSKLPTTIAFHIHGGTGTGTSTAASNSSGAYGIVRKISGQYFAVGSLEIGFATSATKFQTKSSVLVFENRRVNDALYVISVVDSGNASYTTEFILGSKSGTMGIEGCMLRGQDITQTCKYSLDGGTDTDVDNFKLYGTTFFDASTLKFPLNATNAEVLNCSFEVCGEIIISTCVVKYCNFVSSDGAAVLMSSISHNTTNCNFISCPQGVKIDTYNAAAYPFNALVFTGVTYHVNNTSGSTLTVGNANGSNASTYIGTLVNFTGSVQLTMTVKNEVGQVIVGAFAYIDDIDESPYIMNTTTDSGGIATTTYTGSPITGSRWRVRKYGYRNFKQLIDIAGSNISLPITLVVDPQQQ